MGPLQISGFCLNIIVFGIFPLTDFYIPKSARAYLFPQFVKINYFCGGPLSVDPIGPQPVRAGMSTACKDVANVYLDTEITLRDIFASSLVFHRFFSSTLK